MKKVMLILANGALALAIGGSAVLDAQTGLPTPKNCCKTTTEKTKFCCDDCCAVDSNCKLSVDCQVPEE